MNINSSFTPPSDPAIYLGHVEEKLTSMARSGRSKYDCLLEELILKKENFACEQYPDDFKKRVKEYSEDFKKLLAETEIYNSWPPKLDSDLVERTLALKNKIHEFTASYFADQLKQTEHQVNFDKQRTGSLLYLTSWDHRGIWGWEKVDSEIRDLVKLIHKNPHLYHYGESCEAHLFCENGEMKIHDDTNSPIRNLCRGYIHIGIDGTQESLDVIEKIKKIGEESEYFQIKNENYNGCEVYVIHVDYKFLSSDKQNLRSLEEHKQEYNKVWKAIEEILDKSSQGYDEVKWNNEFTKDLDLTF